MKLVFLITVVICYLMQITANEVELEEIVSVIQFDIFDFIYLLTDFLLKYFIDQ